MFCYRLCDMLPTVLYIYMVICSSPRLAYAQDPVETTAQPMQPPTLPNSCVSVFEANNTASVFRGSCDPMTFSSETRTCSDIGSSAVPGNCDFYYLCDNLKILKCPCASGTKFDYEKGACADSFTANCTCPNGFIPSTEPLTTTTTTITATTLTTTTAAPTTKGGLSGGAVAGIIIGVLIVIGIVIAVLVILYIKREKPEEKTAHNGVNGAAGDNPSYMFDRTDSQKSEKDKYATISDVMSDPVYHANSERTEYLEPTDTLDPVYDNRAPTDTITEGTGDTA